MTAPAADRENLREAIISASMQIGSELGEEGLTMRGLAARLGVSPTALYQYFDGKTAILQEIRLRGLTRLMDSGMAAMAGKASLRDRIEASSRSYVTFARENPWLYRVLFETAAGPPRQELNEEQRATLRRSEDRMAAAHSDMFSNLALKGDDVLPHFVGFWWCSMHGLCSLLLGRQLTHDNPVVRVADTDAFVDDFIEHLVASLLERLDT
jgi:AcrR family transcriptional regulator